MRQPNNGNKIDGFEMNRKLSFTQAHTYPSHRGRKKNKKFKCAFEDGLRHIKRLA